MCYVIRGDTTGLRSWPASMRSSKLLGPSTTVANSAFQFFGVLVYAIFPFETWSASTPHPLNRTTEDFPGWVVFTHAIYVSDQPTEVY